VCSAIAQDVDQLGDIPCVEVEEAAAFERMASHVDVVAADASVDVSDVVARPFLRAAGSGWMSSL